MVEVLHTAADKISWRGTPLYSAKEAATPLTWCALALSLDSSREIAVTIQREIVSFETGA